MENWQIVWREGVAPLLKAGELEALGKALREDDCRLLQGATTTPLPEKYSQDVPVEAACGLGYCFAATQGGFSDQGKNAEAATVGEVEEFFSRMCFEIDQRLGERAGCRWWLTWFDETPRNEMRTILVREVGIELQKRKDGNNGKTA